MVELASVLMAQQRTGNIRASDRLYLINILKSLGRSPNDRIRLGIAEQTDDAPDSFAKFKI
jgi:hypothetical protein